tara:strand:- start:97170 stop:99269 length:2100 start_codon:yes stop_codon:yes gene_type:complete
MVHIENELAANIARLTDGKAPKDAKIELIKQLPPNLQGKIIHAKVEEKLANGNYKLQLKDGQSIEAKISPPPKIGSPIAFISSKDGQTKITEMVVESFTKKQEGETDNKNLNSGNQKQTGDQQNALKGQDKNPLMQKQALIAKNNTLITEKLLQETATTIKPVHKDDPFKQLRPLIGSQITLSTPKGQNLPSATGVISVVVSKPENGLQTLQPQKQLASSTTNIPPFQAKFPTPIPEGTVIKMNISDNKGQILDITPPKAETLAPIKTSQLEIKIPTNIAQQIILSTKVEGLEKALPQNATLIIKTTSQSETLPNINVTRTLNTGEIKTESMPQFKQAAVTAGGIKLTLTSQTSIPEGTEMTIKTNKAGGVDIIKVGNDTAPGARRPNITPVFNQSKQTGQQPQQPPLPALKIGAQYTGVVQGQNEDGSVTLALKDGVQLQVKPQTPLAVGTKVNVVINKNGLPEVILAQTPVSVSKAITLTHLADTWRTLNESLNALQYASPEDGIEFKKNIPNLDKASFLPNMLSFIDAVNQKSIERLAGTETANLLKALGIDFSPDMNNLHTTTQKTPDQPDNWRALLFPYLEHEDGQPKQGGFFWHNQESDAGVVENTRFIVHLELDALGSVQVDGLIQKKDIQLKLKTETTLSENDISGLKSVVRQTLETLDMTGDIHVLKEPANHEKPLKIAIKDEKQYKFTI